MKSSNFYGVSSLRAENDVTPPKLLLNEFLLEFEKTLLQLTKGEKSKIVSLESAAALLIKMSTLPRKSMAALKKLCTTSGFAKSAWMAWALTPGDSIILTVSSAPVLF